MIEQLKSDLAGLDAREILTYVNARFGEEAIFSTSFGIEDQVITHMLSEINAKTRVFTLDTGRLFPETYYVWNRTLDVYKLPIQAYYPKTEAV